MASLVFQSVIDIVMFDNIFYRQMLPSDVIPYCLYIVKDLYKDARQLVLTALYSVDHTMNGVSHGVWRKFYKDGSIQHQRRAENGKSVGIWQNWYENGNLHIKNSYKNGEKHGLRLAWYEDGTPRYIHRYKNGKQHGLRSTWYEDGTPRYEHQYLSLIHI